MSSWPEPMVLPGDSGGSSAHLVGATGVATARERGRPYTVIEVTSSSSTLMAVSFSGSG